MCNMILFDLVFITFYYVKQTHFSTRMPKVPKQAKCQKWAKVGHFKGQECTEYDIKSYTSVHQMKDKRQLHVYECTFGHFMLRKGF